MSAYIDLPPLEFDRDRIDAAKAEESRKLASKKIFSTLRCPPDKLAKPDIERFICALRECGVDSPLENGATPVWDAVTAGRRQPLLAVLLAMGGDDKMTASVKWNSTPFPHLSPLRLRVLLDTLDVFDIDGATLPRSSEILQAFAVDETRGKVSCLSGKVDELEKNISALSAEMKSRTEAELCEWLGARPSASFVSELSEGVRLDEQAAVALLGRVDSGDFPKASWGDASPGFDVLSGAMDFMRKSAALPTPARKASVKRGPG